MQQEDDQAPLSYQPEAYFQEKPGRKAPTKGKGMQLGSKGKAGNDMFAALEAEDALVRSTFYQEVPGRASQVRFQICNPQLEPLNLRPSTLNP